VLVLPWTSWLEKKLTSTLEAKGFQDVHLTVSSWGLSGVTLKSMSVGTNHPLTLEDVTIGYSLSNLWQGDVSALTVKGLRLTAYQGNNQWALAGLEHWSDGKAEAFVPVTFDQLEGIPLDSLKLEDSSLHIISNAGQVDIPFQLTWQKTPTPTLTYKSKAVTFKTRDMEISTDEVSLEAILHEGDKKWDGVWSVKNITYKDGSAPAMDGTGSLTVQADHISMLGNLKSADKTYKADFSMEYALDAPEKSLFTLADASMPWNSGTLSVKAVKIPLSGKHATDVNVQVQHASIDGLMQMLTGKRATATGAVSGTIPVTVEADGDIIFHEGHMKAEQPGTIIMAPDAIPGDNEQITVVRNVLKNLHYTNLSIGVDSDKGNKLSVLLVLEGNNPDVYEGRPVKLSVHLTGDMLSLLQQSIMPFVNPQQLLK